MDIINLPQSLLTGVDNIHGQDLYAVINSSLTKLPIVTTFNGFIFSTITISKINRLVMKISKPDLEKLQSEELEPKINNNHYWQVNHDTNRTMKDSISDSVLSASKFFRC